MTKLYLLLPIVVSSLFGLAVVAQWRPSSLSPSPSLRSLESLSFSSGSVASPNLRMEKRKSSPTVKAIPIAAAMTTPSADPVSGGNDDLLTQSDRRRRLQHSRAQNAPLDLATTFVSRTLESCTESCCIRNYFAPSSSPQSWLSVEESHQATSASTTAACPVCETCEASGNPLAFLPSAIQYILILVLISLSAVFSGLTLGVLGLDKTGLEIIMDSDDTESAGYARRIYPVRKNGNLLLCSLLWGNTAANALLSILIADKFGGIVGVASSTLLILLFGEIIPQAVCNRYALYIGSRAVPLVSCIMILFYPIAKPLAFILDRALGEELATTYSAKELLKLLQIHVQENAMDHETANTMTGALKYKDVKVADVMTPIDNVFMLKTDEKLNFETIARIFKTGYSRIPVYEVNKNNVVGLLFVKDLIFVDPSDATRVADFIDIFGRGVHVVWPDDRLGEVLRELKNGRSHMALVRDVNRADDNQDPFYEVRGIITLEDIIEEILGQEIVDETDAFLDGSHSVKLDRTDAWKFASMRLLDSKIADERLTLDETRAVTAHLMKNYESVVALLTERQLHILIAETPVSEFPTATEELGQSIPTDLLYTKGAPSDVCTLILAGKVTVLVGADEFRSDVSSWGLLAPGALELASYTPDFSAFVSSGPCRCIRLSRTRFAAAVDASALERTQSSTPSEEPAEAGTTPGSDPAVEAGSESSRKSMLMSALRIVDTGNQKDSFPRASKMGGGRAVSFADSDTLRRGVSRRGGNGNVRATTLLSSKSEAVVASQPSRFAFISSPDVSEKSDADGDA